VTFSQKSPDPSSLPAGNGSAVSFSSDGVYLAVGHSTTPFMTIYKRSGDTFAKLADPSTLPASAGTGVSFSTDVTYPGCISFYNPIYHYLQTVWRHIHKAGQPFHFAAIIGPKRIV
jgi:hypothetical protein